MAVDRSSHQKCSIKKVLLKILQIPVAEFLFQQSCRSQPAVVLNKRLWHRCFSVHFTKYLRTLFSRAPPVAPSALTDVLQSNCSENAGNLQNIWWGPIDHSERTAYVKCSRGKCSIKKLFLKISQYLQEKMCWSLFLTKLQALFCTCTHVQCSAFNRTLLKITMCFCIKQYVRYQYETQTRSQNYRYYVAVLCFE